MAPVKSTMGEHFQIRVRGLPEETEYILQSSEEDFMYDAVDADVRIEIDGRPPFAKGSHRFSEDGFLRAIPVLDFVWNLVVGCKHLSISNPSIERVVVTSTDYVLEFERHDDSVQAGVFDGVRNGRILSGTNLKLHELQRECRSIGNLALASIFGQNPALRGNRHLKRFALEIEMLNRLIKR